jgi:hypothetical protein
MSDIQGIVQSNDAAAASGMNAGRSKHRSEPKAEPNIKLNRDGVIATVTIDCSERRNA